MDSGISFSIIIPVYNTEKFIKKCLDSVINQSYEFFEAIVVNDGSTDSSVNVVNQFLQDPRIRLIPQENKGLGGARNTGICAAKGDYLVFLDSDDYISKDMLKELADVIQEEKCDIVAFDAIGITSEGEKVQYYGYSEYPDPINKITKQQLMMMEPTSCFKSYKRDLFIKNQIFFPERLWYEDFATILRIALYAKDNVYIKKPLYYYVQQPNSITHSRYSERMLEIRMAFDLVKEHYEHNNAFDLFHDELEWNCFLHLQYYSAFRLLSYGFHYREITELSRYCKTVFPKYRFNKYVMERKNQYYLMEKVILCDWIGFFARIQKERIKSIVYKMLCGKK